MTLDQIYDTEWMSVRTFNICEDNHLLNLEKLLNYFRTHHTFINLRNCGKKSNDELIEICEKYNHKLANDTIKEIKDEIVTQIENFNRNQRITINSFISVKFSTLSARSSNALLDYLDNNLTVRNFSSKFFDNKSFNIKQIRNIGEKTEKEITKFIEEIKSLILQISNTKQSIELKKLRIQYSIQKIFKIESSIINEYINKNFISESIPFLGFINLLLNHDCFFKNTYTKVFVNTVRIYNKEPLNLEQATSFIGLTRERIRQLRKQTLQEFISNIEKLSILELNLDEINLSDNLLVIDHQKENVLNKYNNTSFNSSFITLIISILNPNKYSLVGNIEDALFETQMSKRFKHNWKNLYLVPSALNRDFSFDEFVDNVSKRANDTISRSYQFNFESYLLNFSSNGNINSLNEESLICEQILNKELNLYLDIHDNIVFKRNTLKQVYEYSLEALETLGKPSKVSDIHSQVIKLYPAFSNGESSIRASMKRKNGFISFGRTSTFGLKKWENEVSNIKGGTIRNIAKEYLKQYDTPKHIDDITKDVIQYRKKTNAYSIRQNLLLDKSKTFIFYKKSHIGLKGIKYPESYLLVSPKTDKKTWEESYNSLKQFIDKHKCLPNPQASLLEEKTLYNWFVVQRSKMINKKLNSSQSERMNHILTKFNLKLRAPRVSDSEKYNMLEEFVTLNKRLPNFEKNEKTLCRFYNKQQKLFERNKLDEQMMSNFIHIAKIIQNNKK